MDELFEARKSVESRNNETSEKNEHGDKTFAAGDRSFIVETTNVTEDKKIVGSNASDTHESVVDKLRYIKQQRDRRFSARLRDLKDAKISADAFVASARILDSVCNSAPATRIAREAPRSPGLRPFVVLERCEVEDGKSKMHSGSATRWSMDEVEEEDIFADPKEDTEHTVEFSQWEYDLPESQELPFHGFSPRKIQCSINESARFKQAVQIEDTIGCGKDNDVEAMLGFSSVEISISKRIADDWRCKTEDYFSKDAFGRASIAQLPLETIEMPLSKETKSMNKERREYGDLEHVPVRKSLPTFATYPPSSSGFSTARGRSISISKAALEKAETIYSQEARNIKKDVRDNRNLRDSPKSENPSRFAICESSGFSTAGGRSISISKAALRKAETVFSEEASSIKQDVSDNRGVTDSSKSENRSKIVTNAPSTSGFSTAGGRSISISNSALEKAETIYTEEASNIKEDVSDNENLKVSPKSENSSIVAKNAPSTGGFSTAGGRSINISKAALKKAEPIYSEEASNIEEVVSDNRNLRDPPKSEKPTRFSTYAPSTSGFSTAGGRSINISKAALKNAETIYSEEASNIEEVVSDDRNWRDAPKSENSSKAATNPPSTVGFSTAGGRAISISKAALKKAETIYTEEASSIKEDVSDNGTLKGTPKSENSSRVATNAPSTSGSSTAGGRSISISEAALKKAETIYSEEGLSIKRAVSDNGNLKDTPKSENSSRVATNAPSTSGFSTAGGRSISISKAALKKAETIYTEEASNIKEVVSDNGNLKDTPKSANSSRVTTNAPNGIGFSTAGGRSISISEAALKKAETIYTEEASSIKDDDSGNRNLQDLPESKIPKYATSLDSVTTNTGRSTNISDSTVVKSRKRVYSELGDCEAASTTWKTPKCRAEDTIHRRSANIGFATARGTELKVSETALAKAKALFDEDASIADSAFASKNVSTTTKSNDKALNSSRFEQGQHAVDLDDMDSINFDDFVDPIEDDELSKKRKIDNVDEETPLRGDANWKQKRGRYVNELQGKKLFFEDSNCEDDAPTERSTHDATAAALLEDEERCKGLNVWNNGNRSSAKTETKIIAPRDPVSSKHVVTKIVEKTNVPCPAASTSSNRATGRGLNSLDNQPESIPDDLNFDTQFSDDEFSPLLDEFILETMKIMEARLAMTRKQDETIRGKRRTKPQHCDGYLYKLRVANSDKRISWQELTEGAAPELRQISNKSPENVRFVTANSAESYSFCCADLFGSKKAGLNAEGIKVGDDAFLILDEKNRAGACEFERAFLASPGVDPNLVPTGWVRNHYRWIVWKLASMDRVDFGHKYLPRMLTPDRVMYELKYRYDREIYRTQWPPLRRILEKNEDPAARIVLCVSSISVTGGNQNAPKGSNTPTTLAGPSYKMKLTDGWYCIDACIDAAMNNCIKNGKVKEGTKLMTVGAKAMNLDQGCSVLEIPADVSLRIHTNSTRRVKWYTKLDYYRINPGPMLLSLKSIKPTGGMICKLVVAVARLYPILYREKLPDGQFVFRNARCDEEAALAHEARHQAKMDEILASARAEFQAGSGNVRANERTKNRVDMNQSFRDREDELRQMITTKLRECLPPPRDVTPVMKIRVAEGETSAMLTVWSNDRDNAEIFVEGSSVAIYNSFASRQRLNELQITAGRSSFMKRETARQIVYPKRIFTPLADVAEPGFSPVYGEFDTIGIVSSIGPAPHGMKNFDTVNLACPRATEDSAPSFLSVLFWQGVSTHGYSKILTVGSLVACSNLEWRKNTAKSIPTAYCTERSVFSKNPRQNHLCEAFETLRRQIKEPLAYAATCATIIEEEIARKTSLRTPCKGTPYRPATSNSLTPVWTPRDSRNSTGANCTPGIDSRKASTMKRLEKLEAYGEPPELPSLAINNSSRKVLSDFRSPVVTPVTKS